jgi:glycine cleavage system H protein
MDPAKLRYAPTHEWVDIQGDTAVVGISKFAVDQLTDLLTIELPAVGTRVAAGKSMGEVESVKSVNDVYAPISGEVVEVNEPLAANVQILSDDPYDKGWLVKLKVDDPAEADKLMDHASYEKRIAADDH